MERYRIKEAKTGVTSNDPMFVESIVSVTFGDENNTYHINLVETEGIPQFIVSKEDIFDRLIRQEIETCDGDEIMTVYDFNEFMEHDFNLMVSSCSRLYRDCISQPDNPVSSVVRYLITLANFGGTNLDVDEYIKETVGKYADETGTPEEVLEYMMEDDEEWWEEREESEEDDA